MTSSSLPANPFVAAGIIEDLRLFVGREDELRQIISRMEGAQPTSINIYGEKRIGKSSLLYHFFLTWEYRVQSPSRYVVIYLSLQNVQCQTENQFYQAIADELLKSATVVNNSALSQVLQVTPLDRGKFSDAVREWKKLGVLPVLCLDDFKTLFENKTEFNNGFYDNLRSLMNSNSLMLVIATNKVLDFYIDKNQLTSPFSNLFHMIKLGELKKDEVEDLLRLPASTVHNTLAVLSLDEQRLCQQLAGSHPFLLQLAGSLACEARQLGHDENWVKKRFAAEMRRLPSRWNRKNWRQLRWWVWELPVQLGKITKFAGTSVDGVSSWIIGLVIMLMLILVILGISRRNDLCYFIRKILEIKYL
ncbi:MAG TPA: ATP-binding protein [Nostocaceae cyanobacterium]|nr:ATP-binding protein [Nostocaceae cyanobacterium]